MDDSEPFDRRPPKKGLVLDFLLDKVFIGKFLACDGSAINGDVSLARGTRDYSAPSIDASYSLPPGFISPIPSGLDYSKRPLM